MDSFLWRGSSFWMSYLEKTPVSAFTPYCYGLFRSVNMRSFTIRNVQPEDLEILIQLYIACFREPPWNEVFTPEEVLADFTTILSRPETVFLVAVDREERVVAAAIGFHVCRKPDVWERLPRAMRNAFYLAEVFVDPASRQRGVCASLMRTLCSHASADGATEICARTSVNQSIIKHVMVDRLGCAVVGTEDVVSRKVMDGETVDASDTRILMAGAIRSMSDTPARGCHSGY